MYIVFNAIFESFFNLLWKFRFDEDSYNVLKEIENVNMQSRCEKLSTSTF